MNTLTTPRMLSQDTIDAYRRDGFVHIPGAISPEEAERFRAAAVDVAARSEGLHQGDVFSQHVNVWRDDESMRALTLHPNIGALAEQLTGVPLRLWHDQTLIKKPRVSKPTEFHQDQPYWPHADSPHPISAWIALCDVPVERGCMTFIPGSHTHTELAAQNLQDERSLMSMCPEMQWMPRVTLPLRAGDCTFHHGRCAHMATPNFTDEPRVAHVVIFIDTTTTYTGAPHVVTDPLNLTPGRKLEGEMFPEARHA